MFMNDSKYEYIFQELTNLSTVNVSPRECLLFSFSSSSTLESLFFMLLGDKLKLLSDFALDETFTEFVDRALLREVLRDP